MPYTGSINNQIISRMALLVAINNGNEFEALAQGGGYGQQD